MSPRRTSDSVRLVALTTIDEPELAMRESMDERALAELAENIRDIGLIHPIMLRPRGARFQIVAGHRRFLACRLIALETVPAIVRDIDESLDAAIKVAENVNREDVNAGEEAVFFETLLERHCAGDTDRLAKWVRKSREYVEHRILLARGDLGVLAAVKERKLSLAVASELNAVRDPATRRMYLEAAARGGATARLVRDWRQRAESLAALQAGESVPALEYHAPPAQPAGSSLVCILCNTNEDVYELELVYMHRGCKRILFDRLIERATSGHTAPDAGDATR